MLAAVPQHIAVPANPLRIACQAAGITVEQARSKTRARAIAYPRFHVMWILREDFGMSFPDIGRRLQRDHTSIVYGVRRYAQLRHVPQLKPADL